MTLLICPGIHDPHLTQGLLDDLGRSLPAPLIVPADQPPYSAAHGWDFLMRSQPDLASPLTVLAFSAGVVGAIGVAWAWYARGYPLRQLIAVDGWGVPLYAPFPIYRVSHDAFTHWSSCPLGGTTQGFYADPPVAHLDLWRSPHTAQGWAVRPAPGLPFCPIGLPAERTTAAAWLQQSLASHLAPPV